MSLLLSMDEHATLTVDGVAGDHRRGKTQTMAQSAVGLAGLCRLRRNNRPSAQTTLGRNRRGFIPTSMANRSALRNLVLNCRRHPPMAFAYGRADY